MNADTIIAFDHVCGQCQRALIMFVDSVKERWSCLWTVSKSVDHVCGQCQRALIMFVVSVKER